MYLVLHTLLEFLVDFTLKIIYEIKKIVNSHFLSISEEFPDVVSMESEQQERANQSVEHRAILVSTQLFQTESENLVVFSDYLKPLTK